MQGKTALVLTITTTFLMFLCLAGLVRVTSRTVTGTEDRKTGAYYYIWYGLNTSSGYNTNWENKTETPYMGEYSSSDPDVADQHILWAKLNKIDFFAVSWLGTFNWFDHLAIDKNLQNGFLKAKQLGDFSFCLLYESEIILNSVYNKFYATGLGGDNPTDFFRSTFSNDIDYAAQNYFSHPSYLRIEGKPVLFLHNLPYLCQNLSAPQVHAMLVGLRQRVANNIYLVACVGGGPNRTSLGFQLPDFMDVLDAATSYLFSSPSKGWSGILEDAERYYHDWHSYMASQGKQFIPSAYPGYNATKGGISATLSVNATEFRDFLQIALNNVDKNGIAMITSWNEWKESTAIEPSMEFGHQLLDIVYEIPELPSTFILLIVLLATASPVLVYRKKCLSDEETRTKEKSKGLAHAAEDCRGEPGHG